MRFFRPGAETAAAAGASELLEGRLIGVVVPPRASIAFDNLSRSAMRRLRMWSVVIGLDVSTRLSWEANF